MITLLATCLVAAIAPAASAEVGAIQERKDYKVLRAWDMQRNVQPPIPWGYGEFVDWGANQKVVEILIRIPFIGSDPFPTARTTRITGLRAIGWATGRWNRNMSNSDAGFGVIGVPTAKVATLTVAIASGAATPLGETSLRPDHGVRLGKGFLARASARDRKDSSGGEIMHQTLLTLDIPPAYRLMDLHLRLVDNTGKEMPQVSRNGNRKQAKVWFDQRPTAMMKLQISARKFKAYTFSNIPLQPRK